MDEVLMACFVAADGPADGYSIQLYPNPTQGGILIKGPNPNKTAIILSVMNGCTVLKANTKNGKTDVSRLPDGIYFIAIQPDMQITVKRMIKLN